MGEFDGLQQSRHSVTEFLLNFGPTDSDIHNLQQPNGSVVTVSGNTRLVTLRTRRTA